MSADTEYNGTGTVTVGITSPHRFSHHFFTANPALIEQIKRKSVVTVVASYGGNRHS